MDNQRHSCWNVAESKRYDLCQSECFAIPISSRLFGLSFIQRSLSCDRSPAVLIW